MVIGIPIPIVLLCFFYAIQKHARATVISSGSGVDHNRPTRRQTHGQAISVFRFSRIERTLALPEPGAGIFVISAAQISSPGGGACRLT
ncbi:hypothetical protein [Rhizobium laguerreae]|uniref:Uncharacterized protein n=1 Tax=Rhizobium laguerreae TaxID=1076926 RepID=A0A6N9ZS40_9HYPH|nr:hypothetical protein [Rhizobium laguerreae]NEH95810.1 hypothetical protein [Rhizobium laguerreae]